MLPQNEQNYQIKSNQEQLPSESNEPENKIYQRELYTALFQKHA